MLFSKSKSKKMRSKKIRSKKIRSKKMRSKKGKIQKRKTMQKGGKGGLNNNNNNDNDNNANSGFFGPFASAFSTIKSALPNEITGETEETNANSTKIKQHLVSNSEPPTMSIIELLEQAESRNPGDFKTYNGTNPFMSEKELDKQDKQCK